MWDVWLLPLAATGSKRVRLRADKEVLVALEIDVTVSLIISYKPGM